MKNKKALSEVVSIVAIIAITIIMVTIIWGVIDNTTRGRLEKASSCHNIFEKISLDDDYTCYNQSANRMQFSISRGEIDLDYLLIGLTFDNFSKTYKLYVDSTNVVGITNYPSGLEIVSLPAKNAGKTYFAENIQTRPDSIEIAPAIKRNLCDTIDEINEIVNCV